MVTVPYYLIYASTAAKPFTQQELLDLLSEARKRNALLGITGLLLYAPGNGEAGTFVQELEGTRPEVRGLYDQIIRDPRHRDCTLMRDGQALDRRFQDWTMGFKDLSALKPEEVPGFNPVFLQNWTLKRVLAEPDPVIQLLYSFAGT